MSKLSIYYAVFYALGLILMGIFARVYLRKRKTKQLHDRKP